MDANARATALGVAILGVALAVAVPAGQARATAQGRDAHGGSLGRSERPASPGGAPHAAWASLFPPRLENLRRCDSFQTTVDVWGAVDLAAFQLEVGFDAAVIEFSSAAVAPWLAEQWPSYIELPPVISDGNVLFAAAADDGAGAANGDGEMALLTFRAIGAGTSDLPLHDVRLVDRVGAVVAVTSTGAVAHVLDEDGDGCVGTGTPSATRTPTGTRTDSPEPTMASPTPTPSTTATREPTPGTPVATTPGPSPTDTPASATPTRTTPATAGTATATASEAASPLPGWALLMPYTFKP
jgi:hypothetical protein